MPGILGSTPRKSLVAILCALALMAATAVTLLPVALAGVPTESPADLDAFDDLVQTRPYYSPEVAGVYNPEAEQLQEKLPGSLPSELLPESLQPEREEAPKAGGGDFSAAGAGGWTPLARPYTPSPDPAVSYWASSFGQIMDNSGRLHVHYERLVMTDISQPPDAAGFMTRNLANHYHDMSLEGAWAGSTNFSNVSGLGDSSIMFFDDDAEGNIHVVYTAWTWGRDPNIPAGDPSAYQHENENLWYRFRTSGGTWSDPERLTNYTGSWGIQGAEFMMRNNRLYGTWVAVLNHETLPASYRAQAGFVEGWMEAWEAPVVLSQWDYTLDPGQQIPVYWPSIDVSRLAGEVAVAYGVQTQSGVVTDVRSDIYAAVRDTGGTWSGPQDITSAAANQFWLPIFLFYKNNANRVVALSYQYVNFTDAAHPPRNNFQLIYHDSGGWEAPLNITRVADEQDGQIVDVELDPFQNVHFSCMVTNYAWVGGNWEPRGAFLRYTREIGGGLSGVVTILGYLFRRYPADVRMLIDRDGNTRILFSTVMYDGATFWDWNVNYTDNAPAGDPTAFNAVDRIRPNTAYEIFTLNLSAFPDGDVLASWFEKGFVAGAPTWGRMFSRYRDGTTWQGTVPVSVVPGSTDILHVIPLGWPSFEAVEISDTGEQRCVFETAKYSPGPAEYYDFRKYFTETVSGVWTQPELISSAGISGDDPELYEDGGRRYYVLYSPQDPATNKEVLYATQ